MPCSASPLLPPRPPPPGPQTEFREDLKGLYRQAGCANKPTVFLFDETQIVFETFLEDVNNILTSGEVPNLFPKVRGRICESSRCRGCGRSRSTCGRSRRLGSPAGGCVGVLATSGTESQGGGGGEGRKGRVWKRQRRIQPGRFAVNPEVDSVKPFTYQPTPTTNANHAGRN